MFMMNLVAYQLCLFVIHRAVFGIGLGDLVMDGAWAI
jgi:hypothetical protein